MKNVEKFPKGCRKVRPPALHPLCITCLLYTSDAADEL